MINADGSGLTRLPNEDYSWYPDWAPDSRRIVFVRVVNGLSQLFIIDADGTHEVKLSTAAAHEFQPSWSPLP